MEHENIAFIKKEGRKMAMTISGNDVFYLVAGMLIVILFVSLYNLYKKNKEIKLLKARIKKMQTELSDYKEVKESLRELKRSIRNIPRNHKSEI